MSNPFSRIFTALLVARAVAQWPDPEPYPGNCTIHDPSLIRHTNGTYFLFGSGGNLRTAPSLSAAWTERPDPLPTGFGAPDVHLVGDTYYMYHQHDVHGTNLYSNISVASSLTMETGSWVEHANLSIPENFQQYNLIDPNLLIAPAEDNTPEKYYLSFGSYWHDIHQVNMSGPLHVSSAPIDLEYNHTTGLGLGENPSEGSFQFMWTPVAGGKRFFYLFFSSGYCCAPTYNIPPGDEYKIMVCRSENPSGPFVDAEGKSCKTENGGTLILGSHDDVYAPGGQGVLYDGSVDGGSVILYYHYIKNFKNTAHPATFGWNKLDFDAAGWPFIKKIS
ncbi:hypothetical protein G7Y89_g2194 [Cudoniella acicularis]|uniref:Endo-1,5-alpha-L-arabinanase A n=1 Tax=Cudoniella acicularis TaxID=354080 RepID=A0A8H4RWR2_9HELO|nr:hypothetical protein G7Y89_g2194 [Cudoniella acicularis]